MLASGCSANENVLYVTVDRNAENLFEPFLKKKLTNSFFKNTFTYQLLPSEASDKANSRSSRCWINAEQFPVCFLPNFHKAIEFRVKWLYLELRVEVFAQISVKFWNRTVFSDFNSFPISFNWLSFPSSLWKKLCFSGEPSLAQWIKKLKILEVVSCLSNHPTHAKGRQ